MAKLEDLKPGVHVLGIGCDGHAQIVSVKWYGENALGIIWEDSQGQTGSQIIYPENSLAIGKKPSAWTFDVPSADFRLATEAMRIQCAHLFDPYLAVHTSTVDPLPHQISAVYQEMLPRQPLRFVLADDPGAGKTIMTGLLIKELMARGDLARCLIVCPGSLAEQWQDELYRKFHLVFEIFTSAKMEASITGNIFEESPLLIGRLDQLARNLELQAKLGATEWDLIVCDEAHKMSAAQYGDQVKATQRYRLGELLSGICRHFLLLTATPHNGKEDNFRLFLALVDYERFGGENKNSQPVKDVSDVMRRLVKEDLLKFDGTPLFPQRKAVTVSYDLTPMELELYEAVSAYVRDQFNRADRLDNRRKTTVGFALTVLQRRLASSPEAIWQSLARRGQRLRKRLEEEKNGIANFGPMLNEEIEEDETVGCELEELEQEVADRASASASIAELEAEIAALEDLERMAAKVRRSGKDRKWEELSGLLQDGAHMRDEEDNQEKLIIFTEHRDTLRYLREKISSLLGDADAVLAIHGGMNRNERRLAETSFKQDKRARILIATDAAGEGLNLQRAHLMINYDLPWNPNRLEQRFGRIHRIGQAKTCWLWNLVAAQTREGAVFQRLFSKLEMEKAALGGKVFDILGKLTFNNRPLKQLLIEAVRAGRNEKTQDDIAAAIDHSVNFDALQKLMADHALTEDFMNLSLINSMREHMERMEARRMQPNYIGSFFMEAFKKAGGKIHKRENGRFEITHVPASLRATRRGRRDTVLPRYERVCFDKQYIAGNVDADLLCPGHPLLQAVVGQFCKPELLKSGSVFIDKNDPGQSLRLLYYLDCAIEDGIRLPNGKKRLVSRQIHFVEMDAEYNARDAGYAPHLDCQLASQEQQAAILAYAQKNGFLRDDMEGVAMNHAVSQLMPRHLQECRQRAMAVIDKTERAVRSRLLPEIRYWDYKAVELQGNANAAAQLDRARNKSEEMASRLQTRLAELEAGRQLAALPPRVIGCALIAPAGLVAKLAPDKEIEEICLDAKARKRIEMQAMQTVLNLEASLGHEPRDVSAEKLGYDIESRIPQGSRGPDGNILRFIEVKGRAKGADSVYITKNEQICALNMPEQFILALVEVDADKTTTIYLKNPFKKHPDDSQNFSNHSIAALLKQGEIILRREDYI